MFELEWNKLADRVVPQAREISRFPANRRDIAVVVAENVPAADILSECKKVGVNQVVGVNLLTCTAVRVLRRGIRASP